MTTANSGAAAQGSPSAASASAAAAAGTPAAGAADAAAAAAAAGAAAAGAGAANNDAAGAGNGAAAAAAGAGDGKGKQEAAAAAGAPAKYELAVPDGGPLDQSDLDAFAVTAKAKGLTNEQAQAAVTEMSEALTAQSTRFLEETTADSEVGGANLEASQAHARTVLDKFLPADTDEGKALRSALTKNGYGNYRPLVKLLARIGKAMAEDKPIAPDASRAAQPRDPASVLYG